MENRAVIFDWDGVIADSVALFYRLYHETCNHFKRPLPISSIEQFRGWYKARWEQNYIDMGFTELELEHVLDHARSLVDYTDVKLFPEVVQTIKDLAGTYRLGIASTTDSSLIQTCLEREGLLHLFTVVVGGEEGGSDKIERYGDALKLLEADAKRSVAVGDTALDVTCARHWGMRTIGVTYGWNIDALVREAEPDRIVAHPSGVEAAVRALLAGE